MKVNQYFLLAATVVLSSFGANDEWQRVAFLGDARVKSISGLVEVIVPDTRVLREGETAKVGDTLRIWKGAELILQMESSKSLVRAKGPVLLRLAPLSESFERASLDKPANSGFEVRALRGGGRYSEDGIRWHDLRAGLTIAEGSRVRPFRDSVIDLYDNRARTSLRLSEPKAMALVSKTEVRGGGSMMAAKAP